jgi:hypothetical protein
MGKKGGKGEGRGKACIGPPPPFQILDTPLIAGSNNDHQSLTTGGSVQPSDPAKSFTQSDSILYSHSEPRRYKNVIAASCFVYELCRKQTQTGEAETRCNLWPTDYVLPLCFTLLIYQETSLCAT